MTQSVPLDERYHYKAYPLKVTDGDTLHVRAKLPLDESREMVLRLYGIDVVELHSETGQAAADFVVVWILDNCGWEFYTVAFNQPRVNIPYVDLYTIRDTKEKYGRYLAVVHAGGRDLATDLREAGFEKSKPSPVAYKRQ